MTRFDEMLEAGRAKPTKEVLADLESLARDPRFASVLESIRQSHARWIETSESEAIASDHGKLARATGAAFALRLLMEQLRKVVDRPVTQRTGREPGEG